MRHVPLPEYKGLTLLILPPCGFPPGKLSAAYGKVASSRESRWRIAARTECRCPTNPSGHVSCGLGYRWSTSI